MTPPHPDLRRIRQFRRQLGLTQAELAKMAGISQSLVAKVETGRVDPSYSKAKALFDALNSVQLRTSRRAKDIMVKDVISVNEWTRVGEAVDIMYKNAISQLPVVKENDYVGSISEKTLISRIASGEPSDRLFTKAVGEVMDEPFPIANEETPTDALVPILNYYQAVLIARKGRATGIVTRSDLLKPA